MGRPVTQPILRSINRVVAEIPPDLITPGLEVRIEQARNLARQLDAAGPGGSGAVAQALPAINRELTATLEYILAANPDSDPFLDELFRDDETGLDVRIKMRATKAASGWSEDDVETA
jgi:hypothetical protein